MDDRRAARLADLLAEYLNGLQPDDWPETVGDLAQDLLATVPLIGMADGTTETLDRYLAREGR